MNERDAKEIEEKKLVEATIQKYIDDINNKMKAIALINEGIKDEAKDAILKSDQQNEQNQQNQQNEQNQQNQQNEEKAKDGSPIKTPSEHELQAQAKDMLEELQKEIVKEHKEEVSKEVVKEANLMIPEEIEFECSEKLDCQQYKIQSGIVNDFIGFRLTSMNLTCVYGQLKISNAYSIQDEFIEVNPTEGGFK